MKRIITLTLFAFAVLSAGAQYGKSVLNLRLNDNAPFKVFIDGQQLGGIDNTIRLANLNGGNHFLQVYRVIKVRGFSNQRPAFSGNVVLTGNAESWATVYPEVQKIKFDDIRAFAPNHPNPNQFNPRAPKPLVPCTEEVYETYPTAPVGPCAMAIADFNQLKNTLDNAAFENTRLSIFKQALGYNYFTTAQVRELMDLFWFENSKLEVAKLAYPKTVDPNNYYLVNNEFSFSSSVNELGNYIAMR